MVSEVLNEAKQTAALGEANTKHALRGINKGFVQFGEELHRDVASGHFREGVEFAEQSDVVITLPWQEFTGQFERFPFQEVKTALFPSSNLTIGVISGDRITAITDRGSYFTMESDEGDVQLELKSFRDKRPTQLLASQSPLDRASAGIEFLTWLQSVVEQRRESK